MKTSNFCTKLSAWVLGVFLCMGLLVTHQAMAVDGDPAGLFELDGNPNADAMAPGDDWEDLWVACGQDPSDPMSGFDPDNCANSEVFSGIIPDFFDSASDPTTFTGGGSKDPEDIEPNPPGGDGITGKNWLYKAGTVQDKNEITNGFAAAYLIPQYCEDAMGDPVLCFDPSPNAAPIPNMNAVTEPGESCWDTAANGMTGGVVACSGAMTEYGLGAICNDGMGNQVLCHLTNEPVGDLLHDDGDLIVYFGADRWSNDGDAYMAFWFLQDNIGLTGVKSQGGLLFDGVHKENDVVVIARFPQASGADPILQALKWTDNAADTLDSLIFTTEGECDGGGDKLACAITNNEDDPDHDHPTVWNYEPKPNVSEGDGVYPYETFVSGGINVSRLLQGTNVCFSSFLVETRASKTFSETATLSDFVLGKFQLCTASARTIIHEGERTDATPHTPIDENNTGLPVVGDPVVGDRIHDSVLISGTALGADAPDPTGDVTFVLFSNNTCTPDGEADPEGFPVDGIADAEVLHISTGALSGNLNGTSSAESVHYDLTQTGGHCYRAFWPGNEDYPSGAVSGIEPFNVIQPKFGFRKEILSCADDSGTFAFSADSGNITDTLGDLTVASLTDGGSNLNNSVPPGSYAITETTNNAYVYVYDSMLTDSTNCANTSSGVQTVTVDNNENFNCVFLNVRKPQVTVKKITDDTTATFDLKVGTTTVNDDGLDRDGSTLISSYNAAGAHFGTPTVSEKATGMSLLSSYTTVITCTDGTVKAWEPNEFTNGTGMSANDPNAERLVTLQTLLPGKHVTCEIENIPALPGDACLSDPQ